MRYYPKFITTLEERPKIFNVNKITAYAGGSRKVWGKIVKNEIYKTIFKKIDYDKINVKTSRILIVGRSYHFKTILTRVELQLLYLNDIRRRELKIATFDNNIPLQIGEKRKMNKNS